MQEKEQTTRMQRPTNLEETEGKKGGCGRNKNKQSGWISVALLLLAVIYAGGVNAHGTEPLEEDSCSRRSGEYLVHLSVYQPQIDVSGHYCTDIPVAANSLLVIDLVDPPLREMPIGIKLLKGGSEEGDVLAELRPQVYPDGVINTQQELDQGRHLVVITADGMPPLKYVYQLRVEMINYGEVFRATIGPTVGLLLIMLIGYKLFKSKRFKKWLASRRNK